MFSMLRFVGQGRSRSSLLIGRYHVSEPAETGECCWIVEPRNQCVSTSKIQEANLVLNNRGVPLLGKKHECKIDSSATFIRDMLWPLHIQVNAHNHPIRNGARFSKKSRGIAVALDRQSGTKRKPQHFVGNDRQGSRPKKAMAKGQVEWAFDTCCWMDWVNVAISDGTRSGCVWWYLPGKLN